MRCNNVMKKEGAMREWKEICKEIFRIRDESEFCEKLRKIFEDIKKGNITLSIDEQKDFLLRVFRKVLINGWEKAKEVIFGYCEEKADGQILDVLYELKEWIEGFPYDLEIKESRLKEVDKLIEKILIEINKNGKFQRE